MNKCTVDSYILIYAFRYALGRMTGAPIDVVNAILENKDKLDNWQQRQIYTDICRAEKENRLGMDCDKEVWLRLKMEFSHNFEEKTVLNNRGYLITDKHIYFSASNDVYNFEVGDGDMGFGFTLSSSVNIKKLEPINELSCFIFTEDPEITFIMTGNTRSTFSVELMDTKCPKNNDKPLDFNWIGD